MVKRKLNVLFAASEAYPFMKTGGLGDVAGSLPKALQNDGVEVRVIVPKYRDIPQEYKDQMEHVCDFYMPLGWRNVFCGIEKITYQGVIYYFVDNEYYFNRGGAYGYFDDGERIAFFSKAIVECLQYLPDFKCDVLHCNDWHTALAPVFLREFYNGVGNYDNIKTVFTVHNLKFQGQMSDMVLGDILGLDKNKAASEQLRCDSQSINFLKGALCYSDILTTVSETYAGEIQSDFFGENMQDIFRRRSNVLYGIVNGIDVDFFNPEKSTNIVANYSADDLAGKRKCKEELQKELGLEVNADIPLIVMIGRLTQQKGLDLIQRVLDELMQQSVQFAVLGTGDYEYEEMFKGFSYKYPGKVSANIRFSEPLSHRLYSGGDMLLMPSLFEPCGLSQMIAMHFGTLPIVRETGGLKDTVKPYNMYTGEGTGFSFANYNAHEMLFTIKAAIDLYYNNKDAWTKMQKTAMKTDFSWNVAADKYKKLYEQLHPEIEPYVVEKKDEKIAKEEKTVENNDKKEETVKVIEEKKEVVKEEKDTDTKMQEAVATKKAEEVKPEEKKEAKVENEAKKASSSTSKKQTSSASKTTAKPANKTAGKTAGKTRKTAAKKTTSSRKTVKKDSDTTAKAKTTANKTVKKEDSKTASKVNTTEKDNNKK